MRLSRRTGAQSLKSETGCLVRWSAAFISFNHPLIIASPLLQTGIKTALQGQKLMAYVMNRVAMLHDIMLKHLVRDRFRTIVKHKYCPNVRMHDKASKRSEQYYLGYSVLSLPRLRCAPPRRFHLCFHSLLRRL